MESFFQRGPTPITATLAGAALKCTSEHEKRVRLDFEVPLSTDLIALAPLSVQSAAAAIGQQAAGLTQATISSEYDQTIELYETPDHTTPTITLSNVHLTGLDVFRPTPKDGPSSDLFLTFSANVKAEAPFGGQLVAWALEHLHGTVFFRGFDVQGSLALDEAPPTPKRGRGKAQAAGESDGE